MFSHEDGSLALLVVADFLWWDPVFLQHCREAIASRYGIPIEAQILSATHTHSAPISGSSFAATLGKADGQYVGKVEKLLLRLVARALKDRETVVTVAKGASSCNLGINRRKKTASGVTMAPNPLGPLDKEVIVVDFKRGDGTSKLLLCHFGCHPTVKADLSISSEYCGVAMDALESATGASAFFLLGCCAEVRPNLQRKGAFFRGGVDDVERLGGRLLRAILAARRKAKGRTIKPRFGYQQARVKLKFQKKYSPRSLKRISEGNLEGQPNHLRSLPESSVRAWAVEMRDKNSPPPELEIGLVSLVEGVSLLALGGEMASEYGRFAKGLAGDLLPISCANGMAGYVPTEQFLNEGGYEGGEAHVLFLYPAAFCPGLESLIKARILKLVKGR